LGGAWRTNCACSTRGAIYHVMNRVDQREAVFRDEQDYGDPMPDYENVLTD